MSNLKKGSTVGGFKIITEEDSNRHYHTVDDIDNLGAGASLTTGPGSNFDADTLNGQHYSDMENSFVNISGDTVSNLSLTNVNTQNNNSAISNAFVEQYLDEEVVLGNNAVPLISTKIDTGNLSYSSSILAISNFYILISGRIYYVSNVSITINNDPNTEVHLSLELSGNSIVLNSYNNLPDSTFTEIYIGSISFDASGIHSYNLRPSPITNLYSVLVSMVPNPNSIIVSDVGVSDIPDNWFYFDNNGFEVDPVNIKGPQTIPSNDTAQYEITDYDRYSTYDTSISEGFVNSVQNGIVTVTAPYTTVSRFITLTISRNDTAVSFNVEITP